jgi:aminoglycoside/choline kinase family phosphotransferase
MTSTLPDEAGTFLSSWLPAGWTAEMLTGDVSARAYFRVVSASGDRYVVAWYPESLRADVPRFLEAHRAIASHTPVPAVIHHDGHSAVAQQDVGDLTLYEVLQNDPRRGLALYRRAVEVLVSFQGSPAAAKTLNPPFDEAKFFEELEMTREWYVERLMGGSGAELQPWLRRIASRVAAHPYTLCHRDYHGQNIHIFNDTLYIIDFQDLRMGPDSYDLASLLRDRGAARYLGGAEEDLIALYAELLGKDPASIRRRYFETLLQRAIKTVGTFARVALARGRAGYLHFIPPALESVERCVEELPEYGELLRHFPMDFSPPAAEERNRD